MMVPSVRDLLLAVAIAAINWVLAAFHRPQLAAGSAAPWWAGLILVAMGLFFLNLHSRKDVEITGIVDEHGRVAIKGRIRCSDAAEAERFIKAMKDRIKQETGEDPLE
jgi:hypothetical protein